MATCAGSSRAPTAKTPAIPQTSEFNSQRKLDLPLVIRQLFCDLARTRSHGFRERACVTSVTAEYARAQVIAAEVCMVQDVEEFRAELQHAGFSQNPSFVSLTSEKSQSLSGGPVRILRPAVPNWPSVGEQFVKPGQHTAGRSRTWPG